MSEISIGNLSYQRKSIWELARSRAWRSQSTSGIRSSVHICSLDQISSLCYLLSSRHASYIIFDLHRDGRCKIHTRYRKRSASRKKQDRFQQISWRFHLQHETFSIRSDDDSLPLAQQISRSEFCETNWHSAKSCKDCSSRYASS